jgi:hypothetical protein
MRPGGFEPPTNGLEGRRSSTELRALGRSVAPAAEAQSSARNSAILGASTVQNLVVRARSTWRSMNGNDIVTTRCQFIRDVDRVHLVEQDLQEAACRARAMRGTVPLLEAQRGLDRARRLVEPLRRSFNVTKAAMNIDDLPDVGAVHQTRSTTRRPRAKNDPRVLVHLDSLDDISLDQRRTRMTLDFGPMVESPQRLIRITSGNRSWSLVHVGDVLRLCTQVLPGRAPPLTPVPVGSVWGSCGEVLHRKGADFGGGERIVTISAAARKPLPLEGLRLFVWMEAGGGNRTRVISLEGWSSTIELHPHLVRSRVARAFGA